ncbi:MULTISPECIES: DNA adenine methylase [Microbacterium]|nr:MULTISPECIES: DNA adenine methylase [Microbacterium]
MGTKRHISGAVREAVESISEDGPILDLFAGMGSVADEFVGKRPVYLNDASEFVGAMLRARFGPTSSPPALDRGVFDATMQESRDRLTQEFSAQLEIETAALNGDVAKLQSYVRRAKHVGTSATARRAAVDASTCAGVARYKLASLYFSAGYLSLHQAIEVDALRFAIDSYPDQSVRDALMSQWLTSISAVLNSPGHSAQFLKPTPSGGYGRVVRAWSKSVTEKFWQVGTVNQPHSLASWRATTRVTTVDALTLLRSGGATDASVIYADPPYTRDQYGRFYHLYETLYKYDFPTSRGSGRVRADTFVSGFSRKTEVETSIRELLRISAASSKPIVLSYPKNGLLNQAGRDLHVLARDYFESVTVESISTNHSTLGGSSGSRSKAATEQLVICL